MTLAIFGITNSGVNLVVSLLLLSLVAMWVALIYWTYEDARRRIEDAMLVWIFTAWSLFPFVGTLIYLIIRPPEFLEDVREREVETRAAEARLHMFRSRSCANCGYEVEPTYLRCPSCLRKLKEPCETCGKPLDPRWRICPFCESEVKRAARAPRPARQAAAARARTTPRVAAPRPRAGASTAKVPPAAERQRRSLASVKPGEGERKSEKPAAAATPEQAERISAAAAIGPKRQAAGQGPPATKAKAEPEKPAEAKPTRKTGTARKASSRRKS